MIKNNDYQQQIAKSYIVRALNIRFMRRSESGVGSLLIFLSTIVVAVLAAVVFITTASNLQQKAFSVGGEAKERVSASVDVESISGLKDPDPAREIHNLTFVVRLAPGADPIKLDDEGTTIQILTDKWQVLSIKYSGTVNGTGIWPTGATTPEVFYVWQDQSTDRDGFWNILSPGELYTIVIPLDASANHTLEEETPVTVKIVSRTGISSTIKFRAPTVIKDQIVQLYP